APVIKAERFGYRPPQRIRWPDHGEMAMVGSFGRHADAVDQLIEGFRSHRNVVGIIGLGYVGLPLAATFAEGGFPVIGFDVDGAKIDELRAGGIYIRHIPPERLAPLLQVLPSRRGRRGFHPTTDYRLLRDCDAILICVPTPLTENRE